MTVTSIEKDPENLTMTITAQFDASIELVWQMWGDPPCGSVSPIPLANPK